MIVNSIQDILDCMTLAPQLPAPPRANTLSRRGRVTRRTKTSLTEEEEEGEGEEAVDKKKDSECVFMAEVAEVVHSSCLMLRAFGKVRLEILIWLVVEFYQTIYYFTKFAMKSPRVHTFRGCSLLTY